jgi:hypothetical protein
MPILIVACLLSSLAYGQPASDTKPAEPDTTGTPPLPVAGELPPPSAEPGEERPLPDYAGREAEPASAGDVLIWIPRGILYPAHLAMNYLVRWPLVSLFTLAEKHYILPRLVNLFSWASGKAGIFPTAFYEFGVSPSVGFYAFFEDVWYPNHKLIIRGGFWADKQQIAISDDIKVFRDHSGTLSIKAGFFNRPDHPFHGIGYLPVEDDRANYNMKRGEGIVSLQGALQGLSRVNFSLAYRYSSIRNGSSPSIEEEFDTTDENMVPGYGRYHLLLSSLKLDLDTRSAYRDLTAGDGMRLELFTSFGISPENTDLHFLRWGGEISGYLDLTGLNHILGLRLYTEFLETTGSDPVPFTEMIVLGGAEHMRASLAGRFRGHSALVITADYRYPIWAYLDGELFLGLGNTFGEHLHGFAWDRMHLSWGIGLRSNNSRDVSFDIMVAFGSNRLDADKFDIERVHFVVGVNQGF